MASTFANRDTNWYLRQDAGVSELNGGGFDSTVTNAGTNYADQASPQLSLTDLATSAANASITSVTGGFTAQMIGNVIRIASGTNFTADYYVITAVASSNAATVDRTCTTAAGSSGVCRVGGAFAHIKSLATSSGSGSNNPALATPFIGGNTLNIRGDGTQDPSSDTYNWNGDYYTYPSGGNLANGNLKFSGYNGRPRINHQGLLFFNCAWSYCENISFFQGDPTRTTYGPFGNAFSTSFYNCIFDNAGNDSIQAAFGNGSNGAGHAIGCEFRNSLGGAAGSSEAINVLHGGVLIFGCWIHAQRGHGILGNGCYGAIHNSLIQANKGDGYKDDETDGSAPIPVYVMNNTFYANLGDAINLAANAEANNAIFNNLFINHTGSGKFAIRFADAVAVTTAKYKFLIGFNDYFGNTNNFNTITVPTWVVNPTSDGPLVGDLAVNPGFTNAGGNDFSVGTSVDNEGIALAPNLVTPAVLPMGGIRI